MSYSTGAELSRRKCRLSKFDSLNKVYLVKARKNGKNSYCGVIHLPKSMVGVYVRLVEVEGYVRKD